MAVTALDAVAARVPFVLGEVTVEPLGARGWLVRAPGDGPVRGLPADPDVVREAVRFDAQGRYRPLSGARGLPGGWTIRCEDDGELLRVLETIYPLAVTHQEQYAKGTLRVVGLDEVLARQSGRYELARALPPEGRRRAAEVVCKACVRVPVWQGGSPEPLAIPCPEPCSVLVAFCREAVLWERAQAPPGEDDPTTAFADFEAEGNALRNAYLRRSLEGGKEGG